MIVDGGTQKSEYSRLIIHIITFHITQPIIATLLER